MENAINTLRIQNFKSIKDATMHPRRVNLLIGQPNVGKSNILEAMSLLGGMFFDKEGGKFMEGQIRYEDLRNLFYDNDWSKEIKVESNEGGAWLQKSANEVEVAYANSKAGYATPAANSLDGVFKFVEKNRLDTSLRQANPHAPKTGNDYRGMTWFLSGFKTTGQQADKVSVQLATDIKNRKYTFTKVFNYGISYPETYLRPPYGDNMLDVLQYNGAALRKEIADLFKPYGLNFAVRVADRKFEIQKNVDGYIYDYPYSLIADTLQRIIFYLAAIESNDDSVLLFEEPEAHQFPVYTSMLGRKIVESRNNQFFIATHSPYLVTEILEQMVPYDEQAGELAIFLAYYEDYQTKIKQLSDEEVRDIRGDSIDIFYNLARFTPRPVNG